MVNFARIGKIEDLGLRGNKGCSWATAALGPFWTFFLLVFLFLAPGAVAQLYTGSVTGL